MNKHILQNLLAALYKVADRKNIWGKVQLGICSRVLETVNPGLVDNTIAPEV